MLRVGARERFEFDLLTNIVDTLLCPISQNLMKNPVYYLVNNKPQIFDEQNILNWQKRNAFCPLTGVNISQVQFVSHKPTADLIEQLIQDDFFASVETGELKPYHLLVKKNPNKVSDFLRFRLLSAVKNNQLDEVKKYEKFIYEYIKTEDSNRRTLLHHAVSRGYLEMTKLLLAMDADVNAWAGEDEFGVIASTPLHEAASLSQNQAIISLLLQYGANANAEDGRNRTPLHKACESKDNNEAIIQLLLAAGANAGKEDAERLKPADLAKRNISQETHLKSILFLLLADNPEPIYA